MVWHKRLTGVEIELDVCILFLLWRVVMRTPLDSVECVSADSDSMGYSLAYTCTLRSSMLADGF